MKATPTPLLASGSMTNLSTSLQEVGDVQIILGLIDLRTLVLLLNRLVQLLRLGGTMTERAALGLRTNP